ncbi:GvpL/GvpF family gas vesicle protein [Planotetraspora sp. A-T 1434]|uniref:GvpL/GvpF family gas vesicle protein n=1 Tax=Planotetraspora sp. A-T 1434 TaxID=2979219 RepID=UPI0021C07584|nr:GvpL/GvpF family gas vesicle protein [Planotetraspora sp. A-T 1434]MCT9933972.1 GvpL/GvpF family gas vesicle protein [Planotetraspora sp. A-T 1434]
MGTYLYAITREEGRLSPEAGRLSPEGMAGVAGTPVRALRHSGLAAYVTTVPLDQFGEEPLRRSMEDLDWLGETARAHHHVVEAVAETAPTAPVRLMTVYSGDDQVHDLLDRRRDDFAAVLSRVAGRREWGVKAYVAQAPGPVSRSGGQVGQVGQVGQAEDGPAATRPGMAYLKRRHADLRSREEAQRQAVACGERINAVLMELAVAGRRHRPQDPRLSGRDEWMVLNGSYLVDDDRGGEFAALVHRLREEGMDVELSGPWAPYSFADVAGTTDSEVPGGVR